MKQLFIQILKLTMILNLFTACAFDKNDPSAERVREREEDRDKLVQQYLPVEGRYVGKLEFYDRPNQLAVDVELGLILEEENAGVDAQGQPIVRPALRAYFKRADDLNLGLVFKANYNSYIDPNNQNLILTNPALLGEKKMPNTAMDESTSLEITSIRGKLENEIVTAQVLTGAGALGKLSLKLKDKSTEATSMGLQANINEKIQRLYTRIEGTYEGAIVLDGTSLNPVQARVTLMTIIDGKGKPILKAFYERLDLYPVTEYNQELNVDYKTESYPQKISFTATTGTEFSFSGIIYSAQEVSGKNCQQNFTDKECEYYIQGDLVLSKNLRTQLKLVRVKDRYQPKDSQVLGRYSGVLKYADSPSRPGVNLDLSLFVQEEYSVADPSLLAKPIRRQIIKAYVQRSDGYSAGSVYSVSYNDIANADSYNLVLFAPTNRNTEFISLRGNLKNGLFSAQVLSSNGVLGTSELKWLDNKPIAPSDGLGNLNNEKIFKQYKKIEGHYDGIVDVKSADMPSYPIRMSITATMTATGRPILRGYYNRKDVTDGGLNLDLDVDYKPDTLPQRITMSTSSVGNVAARTYFINLEGFLYPQNPNTRLSCSAKENEKSSDCRPVIEGSLLLPKGRMAQVKLIKTTK